MKKIVLLLFVLLLIAPVAFVVAAMEPDPIVARQTVASPADAARTKQIARKFRVLTETTGDRNFRLTQADMNSILASGTRAVPFVRSQAVVLPDALSLRLSADVRRIPGAGWLNFQTVIRPSDSGLNISSVKFGRFNLPEGLVLPVLGKILDWVLDDGLGSVAVRAIDGVAIDGRQVVLGIGLNAADRKALSQRAKQTLRSVASISSPEQVRFYYLAMNQAVRDGQISARGSVLPYIKFAMELARQKTVQGNGEGEVKAALLALAAYCGHPRFAELIGDVIPDQAAGRTSYCANATLQGRADLRQHFTISAGLKAASDTGIAFAIGEFKELLDTNRGGSGFSFDDLAADRAGIRFAEVFLAAAPDDMERLLNLLVSEKAILPRTSDLPSGMSEAEFKRRFGAVDSDAYLAMVDKIDTRLDSLALYTPQ